MTQQIKSSITKLKAKNNQDAVGTESIKKRKGTATENVGCLPRGGALYECDIIKIEKQARWQK